MYHQPYPQQPQIHVQQPDYALKPKQQRNVETPVEERIIFAQSVERRLDLLLDFANAATTI